jgi:hypothetical protein
MNNIPLKVIKWVEPNHRNDPPLHIAKSGERYSTVTGITWLDNYMFVAAHRNGLAIAVFDIRLTQPLLQVKAIKHFSDTIASKKINENTWEIIVSGCYECAFSNYVLTINQSVEFKLLSVKKHQDVSFSHGANYDHEGNYILSYSTGETPRIETEKKIWKLPRPWGPRDVCLNPDTNEMFCVAVSAQPKRVSYHQSQVSVWSYIKILDEWKMILKINNAHSDSCRFYKNRLFLPDQVNHQILVFNLQEKTKPLVLKSKFFDFIHGLDISDSGILAITSYGQSSIILLNIDEL